MNQANHRRHTLLKHTHLMEDITDLVVSADAEDITYDPSASGLAATNVQDALDEIDADLDAVEAEVDALTVERGFPPQLAWAGIR